ncbi:hypothetical protein AK88_04246 [Plasmodium fragile]|uniref:AP2/ERF domain-containing protein n=1 Tax=Plasmodium fragile TaxID=5857 RepID=A0A0D9QGP1_PLAFR|nr:uncharacterized protein AK88_04246 [Plasmodium fragile]KJP86123.1 hypothetical protein AK88_04246 [Plasmodium fragile]
MRSCVSQGQTMRPLLSADHPSVYNSTAPHPVCSSQFRFHPVHLRRAKEVTIRKDYFDSVNENIKYEQLNEQWEVFWFENNKLNAKPFPIKKYGIESAKREAIKFFEYLKDNKRINDRPHYESGVEGVHYDVVTNCWVAFYRQRNFPVCRSFSAEYHGFETAKKLAIERVKKCKG